MVSLASMYFSERLASDWFRRRTRIRRPARFTGPTTRHPTRLESESSRHFARPLAASSHAAWRRRSLGLSELWKSLGAGPCGECRHQLTAFFTSEPILASSAAVNSFSAKATGHRAPSSRFASSLKPNEAYLVLNFCALWKKQTTLPSLAYAGIPYQVFGERAGALALMMAWSRSPRARSGSGISAILASTSLSPAALPARGPRRASAFSSWTRSFIAARSSSVNPLDALPLAVVPLALGMLSVIF